MFLKTHFFNKMTQTQYLVFGFFNIIALGTLLLMLPISSRSGQMTPFIDALFTAVSATCVTGLVVMDTFTQWNLFGQMIILFMIQVGGLGFITIGVLFSLILRRRIGLKTRGFLQESVNTLKIGGIIKLTKKILKGTLFFEGIGTIILGIRFSIQFENIGKGMYFGLFHSVSAFCNAGFDLMGGTGEYSSLTSYVSDPIVNIVIMALIVSGGIGFIVWNDLTEHKFDFKRYALHTKIVLVTTVVLITVPSVLFYFVEYNNTMQGMNVGERILASLFSSVTARTAGFNTIDTGSLRGSSKLLTMVLMFIGGSPGSTAGGIKTTTFFILAAGLLTSMSKNASRGIFQRRLSKDAIGKASMVFTLNLTIVIIACFFMLLFDKVNIESILFETVSAMGTVGMSTGITRHLNILSKATLVMVMFCGRVGSLSFALSFMQKKKVAPVYYPEEKISIG